MGGVIGAQPFEHAHSIMQGMGEHMGRRVAPLDHPHGAGNRCAVGVGGIDGAQLRGDVLEIAGAVFRIDDQPVEPAVGKQFGDCRAGERQPAAHGRSRMQE